MLINCVFYTTVVNVSLVEFEKHLSAAVLIILSGEIICTVVASKRLDDKRFNVL